MNPPLEAATSRDVLLRAAREAAPILRRDAEAAEQNGQLTDAAVDALRDAELFRLGAPLLYGGHEADLATALDVIAEVGLACPSSAWIVMISYAAQQAVGSYAEQTQHEIWSESPDQGICGAFHADTATLHEVDDGLLVSGRWSWASGCHHASWAWLAVPHVEGPSRPPNLALIPAADLTVDKSWNMAGMRATGSDTVVAHEVFVPRHRILSFPAVISGARDPESPPLYRISLGSATIVMLAPMLGAVREVLRLTMATVESGKPLSMSVYPRLADSPSVQGALADATNLIDSATLHLNRSATFLDNAAAKDIEPTPTERGRVRMDMSYASTCLRDAMQLLLTVGGASGFRQSNAIQRYWRDVEVAARHPTINAALLREVYGRALVGIQEPLGPLH